MNALLGSGHLVDVALVAIVVEVFVLAAKRRPGLRLLDIVGQLLAGALLLLALRCVATGADPRWTIALLTASFPAHLFDLVRRARSASSIQR